MEPRLFSHGNDDLRESPFCPGICFNGATTFQSWKHEPITPEEHKRLSLQWSHDFSVMETAAGFVPSENTLHFRAPLLITPTDREL